LTGGQVTLDMDTQEERSNQINESRPRIQRKLAVVKAHTDELNLHQAWIAEMDSGRDGAISIWHKWEQSQTS